MVRDLRRKLVAQLGGNPSPSQSVIIDCAANLSLRLARMDAAGPEGAEYRAATETLLRLLSSLGLAASMGAQPTRRRHP